MFLSANDDFENSNAIHLAKEADPYVQTGTYQEKVVEFGKKHKCLKYIAVKIHPTQTWRTVFY